MMNRPREKNYHKKYGVEDYGIDWKSFAQDVDKYCNQQEEKIDELEMKMLKYDIALNKAIDMIVFQKPIIVDTDKLSMAVMLKESLLNE